MNSPNSLYSHTFEQSDSTLGRLIAALNYRVDQRCADLTPLMEKASRKDLQTFFPSLVDSLFGPQGTQSWGLRNIDPQTHSVECEAILAFLKPLGPVFKMIYTLLMDVNIKYEFGLNYLPVKVRQMLENQNISPFYSEVLQYNTQTKQPISLLLNPYDYFIFHFAYHLINPCHQRKTSDDQWNSVYYNLSAEYLLHFFPTEIDRPILPYINFYQGKNPLQQTGSYQRPPKHTSLLKNNVFTNLPPVDVNTMHQMMDKHPRNEIWRSESILIAFVDFWLSNDQVCMHYDSLNMSAFHELPSADYIRIIRVVIKHMHAFASTSKIDNSALGELKNITIPMIQSRMYVFLRNLLYCWPLDETFRLVLELWLSFIQPWRYSHDQYGNRDAHKLSFTTINTSNQETKHPTEDYLPFIAENLLVYIVIFQQLLPRFARIDLASPKNSQMLFRLTKVFNQPNLVPLIKKIECIVENKSCSPSHTFNSSFAANLPPLSPTTKWCTNTVERIYDSTHIESPKKANCSYIVHDYDNIAGKFLTIVRQKIYELEGPNFCYKPLFTQRAATEVYELLQMIKVAEVKSFGIFMERKKEESSAFNFLSFFSTCSIMDKVPLMDRQKAPMFLRSAADNLVQIFNIEDFNNFDVTPEMTINQSNSCSPNEKSFPCVLTPSRVRERTKTIKYTGDPELIPIRTYESKCLVRACYELSKKINDTWGPNIQSLYQSPGFRGRLARSFIHGPILAHRFEKRNGYSNRVSYIIPPRISLRKYADHKFLTFLFIGSLITYFFNYGYTTFTLVYILFSVFCGLLRAVFFGSRAYVVDLNDSMEEE